MPEISPALAAILGAFVTGLISLAILFISRRFDDRRHMRDLAINAAVQFWAKNAELATQQAQATGKDQYIVPLDSVIVSMLLLAELVSKKRITRENVVRELARIRGVTDIAAEATRPKQQNDRRNPVHEAP